MIKSLLTSVALCATVLTANASDVVLYDDPTGFMVSWSEQNATKQDADACSQYQVGDKINITVTSFDLSINAYPQLALKAGDWSDINTGYLGVSDLEMPAVVSIEITEEMLTIMQSLGWWVSGCATTVTKVTLTSAADIDPNILFEGEYTASGWNKGVSISASKLKAGDILEYTFSEPGSEGAQILVKNKDWANLLGTAKITTADAATGTVMVGVTQEMLDNCGGEIFLQGEGGMTVTKVYRHEAGFDAENVLCYGERIPGAQLFVTIPEDAKYVNVTMTAKPEWMQFCNSSWAPIAMPDSRIENEDGTVTYQFAAEDVAATVNGNNEMIINGGGANLLSVSTADELVLPYDPEKLKLVPNTEGYNLSEQSIAEPMSDLEGFGPESELYILLETRAVGVDEILLNFGWSSTELVEEVTWMPYGVNFLKYDLDKEMYDNLVKNGIWIDGKDLTVKGVYYTVDETLGIDNIAVDENAPVEFYNLQGIKVSADDATNGIFIRRQGGKSTKVIR